MQNMWPDSFPENDKIAAKNLFEEQAKLLAKLTNGVIYAEVSELDAIDAITSSMKNDFAYRFDIFGKFLKSYRFNVLTFSHDITLYPVKFRLDEKLGTELRLGRGPGGFLVSIETPEDLQAFVPRVLSSERLKSVIGSILRLSK